MSRAGKDNQDRRDSERAGAGDAPDIASLHRYAATDQNPCGPFFFPILRLLEKATVDHFAFERFSYVKPFLFATDKCQLQHEDFAVCKEESFYSSGRRKCFEKALVAGPGDNNAPSVIEF